VTVANPRHRRARKIKRVAVEIAHHFHDVRVHDFFRAADHRAQRAQPNFLRRRHFRNQRVQRGGINQRLVSLHVDENIRVAAGKVRRDLRHALGPAAMLAARHHRFPAEGRHRVADARVVGGHDTMRPIVRACFHPLPDVLNHRLPGNRRQRLPRKPRRRIPRRDHCCYNRFAHILFLRTSPLRSRPS
jgi:hypothetical protein